MTPQVSAEHQQNEHESATENFKSYETNGVGHSTAFNKKREKIGLSLILIVLIISFSNIIGWIYDIPLLKSGSPDWPTMRAISAICFIISALTVTVLQTKNPIKLKNVIGKISGAGIAMIGVFTIVVFIVVMQTNMESALINFPVLNNFLDPKNRMALISAILFVIMGSILFLLGFGRNNTFGLAHALILAVLITSYFVPVSYFLGITSMYSIQHTSVALYSGINFCLLGGAILLFYPGTWFMKVFLDHSAGGHMVRRLIPGILIVPIIVGWLRINGERAGLFSIDIGVVLVSVTYTFCFLVLLWIAAKPVIEIGQKQRILDASLRQSEEQYRQLVESANSIIIRLDKNGIFKFVNEYTLKFFGYSKEELIGKKVTMIVPDVEISGRPLESIIQDILNNIPNYPQFENENIKKNGERVWISWTNRAILDETGKIKEILTIGTDLTERKKMEKTVLEQTNFVTSVTETIPDMISIYELPSRKPVYINQQPFALQGFSVEEFLNMPDKERQKLVYPEDQESINSYFEQLANKKDNNITSVEYRAFNKAGELMWFRARGRVFERDSNGSTKSCINILQNITTEKEAEDKLRENEQRLQAMFNNAAIGIVVTDHEDHFMEVNDSLCKILGSSHDELIGKTVSELTAPEDRSVSDSMNLKLHNGEFKTFDYEKRYLKKDGTRVWVHVTVSAIFDSQGHHINSIGTIEDISERKRAEQELRENEKRFRLLADNISQMVWIADEKGDFLWSNKRWFEYTGIPTEEMQDGGRSRVIAPEYLEKVLNSLQQAITTGDPWKEVYPLRRKDGEFRWFLNQAIPVHDQHGKVVQWFGTGTDIHDQKKAEDEARSLAIELEAILKYIPVGVLVYDENIKMLRSNSAANEILQYPTDVGKLTLQERVSQLIEIMTTDGQPLKLEEMPVYKAVVNGETVLSQVLLMKRGSRSYWISFSAAPLILAGKRNGAVVSMQDITSIKIAEDALRLSREELKSITDNSPDVIARFDTQMRHLFINPYGEKVYGLPKREIIGKSSAELGMPIDKVVLWKKLFEDALKTNKQVKVEFEFDSPTYGLQHFLSVFVPEKNERGEVVSILAITRDITDMRRAEEKLRENEVILDTFFNNTPVGMIIYSDDNRYVRLNKLAADQYGLPANEVPGKSIFDILPQDLAKATQMRNKEVRDIDQLIVSDYSAKLPLNSPKAKTTYWQGFRFPVPLPGNKKGVGLVTLDITQRVEAENQRKAAVEELQIREAQLDAFFANAPGILNLEDENFCYINTDTITPTYFGLTRETIKGKSVKDLAPEFITDFGEMMKKVIETGEPNMNAEVHSPVPGRPGEITHWRASYFRVPIGRGKWGIGLIGVEITDMKRTEQKLRENEERFRTLADNISQLAWTADPNGKIQWVNKRWIDYTGVNAKEMQQGGRNKIHHPEYSQIVLDSYTKAIQNGEYWEMTYPLKNRNGEFRWFLTKALPIKDQKGNITQWFGTNTDIHEQKLAEQKASALATELEAILSCTPNGVIVYDNKGRIKRMNQAANDILKYPEEAKNLTYYSRMEQMLEIWSEDYVRKTPEEMPAYKAAIKAENVNKEVLLLKREGRSFWIDFSAAPLYVSGEHTGGVVSMSDITVRKKIEHALRQNEQRLQGIFDNAAIGIAEVDQQNIFITVNNKICEILGYSRQELLGENINKIINEITVPEDLPRSQELSEKLYKGETDVLDIEKRFRKRDGTIIWVHITVSTIRAQNDHRTIRIIEDITARKTVEEALRQNEQRLQGMFNNAAIGIVEGDENGFFSNANGRACEILGYTLEELLGKHVSEITIPEDRQRSEEINEKIFSGQLDKTNYEKQYLKKDGTRVWVHISVSAIRDKQGKLNQTIGTIEDISERKKWEEDLKQSEEMFSTMVNVLPIGIVLSSFSDRKIYKVNPSCLTIMGYSGEEEVLGKTSAELGVIRDMEKQKQYLREFMQLGKIRNLETPIFTKSGSQKIVSINLDQVYIRGEKYNLASVEDITEEKMMEQELRQKNEELTRFIYTVSHDLKSPLVTIKSFTSYLKEDIESEDKDAQDKDIKYIENAADKMGRLLDELLELSRIGKKEDPKSEVPMKTIAQSAVDLVAGRISQRNVKVIITGPDVMLYGHQQRFLQLYQNLIDNAVKFMGNQSEPLIEIGSLYDDSKKEVVLFIRDNGSGIDPQYHHKVFGLFEKLDNRTEGTGIGLALIKRIVEVHNGSIWFTSEGFGKGTTFYFTLEKTRLLK